MEVATMAAIPSSVDPTLAAVDSALVAANRRDKPRPYLGMSALGKPCARSLWYEFRWVYQPQFDALSLKRFADGHAQEDIQAQRLRTVPGVTLLTVDPDTGRQFGYSDIGGHLRGHMDGKIHGLIQAPSKWHVWEHKATDEKKASSLEKLKYERGEKLALQAWDETYYGQAVLYMEYSGLDRHYLTCSTPGGRHTVSCRTEADPAHAAVLKRRAEIIVYSDEPTTPISRDPSFFICRWCGFNEACHGRNFAARNCRICLFVKPVSGGWVCTKYDTSLSVEEQAKGCDSHRYNPHLVPGEQIDAAHDGAWVEYRLFDGQNWRDGQC